VTGRPALVACDLDGTLLDDDGSAVPGIVQALGELCAVGVLVVICTGRTASATRAAAARLGLERGPAISCHGAVVVDLADGRWLERLDLPPQAVGAVVRATLGAGATLTAYVDDERWVQASPAGAALAGVAGAEGASLPGTRAHADLAAALEGRSVTRLIVEGAAACAAATPGVAGPGVAGPAVDVAAAAGTAATAGVAEPLAAMLAGLVSRLPGLALSPAPGGRFEVHHAAADKRTALVALCERLGVPASAVVACGDGAVDAGMIDWAGQGVAIAEGHEAALAVAEGHEAALAVADVVVARGELAAFLLDLAGADGGASPDRSTAGGAG